jgi:glutathione S-transferase
VKLYYFPGACALADHIVLEWTGAPYQTVKLDKAALKAPQFLKLNPNGAVPLLVDGDFVLTQNAAILFYVAERYPQARLLGDTPRGRARRLRQPAALARTDARGSRRAGRRIGAGRRKEGKLSGAAWMNVAVLTFPRFFLPAPIPVRRFAACGT